MAEAKHIEPVKVCTSCGAAKPATTEHFLKNAGGKFGLRGQCIPCHRLAMRERIRRPEARLKRKQAHDAYRESGRRSAQQKAWRYRWNKDGRRCCLPNCERAATAYGWCSAHYRRWKRHGDPLDGRTPPGEPERYLAEIVVQHEGEECLPWPYARTSGGYGNIWLNGENAVVSRLVCRKIWGDPPGADFEAAHSCGKGHEGCVSPHHLSWKKPVENSADKIGHGTAPIGERNARAKLAENDAATILRLRGTATHSEIAARFGVSAALVGRIFRGLAWGHLGEKEAATR